MGDIYVLGLMALIAILVWSDSKVDPWTCPCNECFERVMKKSWKKTREPKRVLRK